MIERKLKSPFRRRIWTIEEDKILKDIYPMEPVIVLLKAFPNKTWDAIKIHARKLGIVREIKQAKTNLSKLLDGSNESYYWCGFIMADGSFSNNRLTVGLSIIDVHHLEKFSSFVGGYGANVNGDSAKVTYMDSDIMPKIKLFLDAKDRKTYNPPKSLPSGNTNQLLSFIIGFIDGDGSIRLKNHSSCSITVKVHSSWTNILKDMANIVYRAAGVSSGIPEIKSNGYAVWDISRSEVCRFLLNFTVNTKIPVLSRKWCNVSKVKNRKEIAKERIEIVKLLSQQGMNCNDIAMKMKIKYGTVYSILLRNNIQFDKRKHLKAISQKGGSNV